MSRKKSKKLNTVFALIVFAVVILMAVFFVNNSKEKNTRESQSTTVTCSQCGKSFSYDKVFHVPRDQYEEGYNIKKNGMCKSCWKNYKVTNGYFKD